MPMKTSFMVLALSISFLCGCGGGASSGRENAPTQNGASSQLKSTPGSVTFGNVAVGGAKSQNGTLAAAGGDVTVSSAAWNGGGFSLSGITFPVTVPAGHTVPFTVTFSPQIGGNSNGQVAFYSDASNSPATVSLTGNGAVASQHSVNLSWQASTSSVAGYNIYRGTQSSGPFAKLNSTIISGISFSDSTVQSGATYYYAATSVDDNNLESGHSNIAIATIP